MENIDNNKIIVFPEFQQLKETAERLKTELSMLMLERDELRYVICKNIETSYLLKFGALEYKAYDAQCTALRLKRKIEMVQVCINRQKKIDIGLIEDMLDQEFEEYKCQLDEQINRVNEALERGNGEFLSEEETRELKSLYRKVVKKLHPDVNPDITEVQLRLMDNAIEAYKNGDLATLRIISEMVEGTDYSDWAQDSMSALNEEIKRIEKLLKTIHESIEEIKSQYPYTMKEILDNPEMEQEHREELVMVLAQYQELIKLYQERLDELLG